MIHFLRYRFLQILQSEQGNVIVLFACAMFVVLVAGGIAIDVAREEDLQSRTQIADDAAALATAQMVAACFSGVAATSTVTTTQTTCMSTNGYATASGCATGDTVQQCMQAQANKYFYANVPSGFMGATNVSVTPTLNANGSVTLTSTSAIPTSFMAIIGAHQQMTPAATTTVGMGTVAAGALPYMYLITSLGVSMYDSAGNHLGEFTPPTGVGSLYPRYLAVDPTTGNVWELDAPPPVEGPYGNVAPVPNIYQYTSAGVPTGISISGSASGRDATMIAVDASSNLWMWDAGTDTFVAFSSSGVFVPGSTITPTPQMVGWSGVSAISFAIGKDGTIWMAAEVGNPIIHYLQGFSPTTDQRTYSYYPTLSGGISAYAVKVDSSGNLWIQNWNSTVGSMEIAEYNSTGTTQKPTVSYTYAIAQETPDFSGNLFTVAWGTNLIYKYNISTGTSSPFTLSSGSPACGTLGGIEIGCMAFAPTNAVNGNTGGGTGSGALVITQ